MNWNIVAFERREGAKDLYQVEAVHDGKIFWAFGYRLLDGEIEVLPETIGEADLNE